MDLDASHQTFEGQRVVDLVEVVGLDALDEAGGRQRVVVGADVVAAGESPVAVVTVPAQADLDLPSSQPRSDQTRIQTHSSPRHAKVPL